MERRVREGASTRATRIGGTADDEDIDFSTDTYSLVEGFTGRENTLNVSAWAFVRGGVVAQP